MLVSFFWIEEMGRGCIVMFYSKISSINWPKQKQQPNLVIWSGDYENPKQKWQKVLENITSG